MIIWVAAVWMSIFPYLQSVTLNGQPLARLVITQTQMSQGARLNFVLSAKPNAE